MEYKILKNHPWLKKGEIISHEGINTLFTSTGIVSLIDEEIIEEIIISKTPDEVKDLIIGNVKELVSSLLYYDRKDDEDLTVNDIESALIKNIITVKEIVEVFKTELFERVEWGR